MPVFEHDNWVIKHRELSRRVSEHIEKLQEEYSAEDEEALGWRLLDYIVLEATADAGNRSPPCGPVWICRLESYLSL